MNESSKVVAILHILQISNGIKTWRLVFVAVILLLVIGLWQLPDILLTLR